MTKKNNGKTTGQKYAQVRSHRNNLVATGKAMWLPPRYYSIEEALAKAGI
jgi:hypothetical protein